MAEVDDEVDLPAVAIVAGTAIRGLAATLMMPGVMRRHPNAFLATLERWGVTIPLHESQSHVGKAVHDGLVRLGRDPDELVVIVGHSQGGSRRCATASTTPTRPDASAPWALRGTAPGWPAPSTAWPGSWSARTCPRWPT